MPQCRASLGQVQRRRACRERRPARYQSCPADRRPRHRTRQLGSHWRQAVLMHSKMHPTLAPGRRNLRAGTPRAVARVLAASHCDMSPDACLGGNVNSGKRNRRTCELHNAGVIAVRACAVKVAVIAWTAAEANGSPRPRRRVFEILPAGFAACFSTPQRPLIDACVAPKP